MGSHYTKPALKKLAFGPFSSQYATYVLLNLQYISPYQFYYHSRC